jgi:hypothetical protein
MSAELVGKEGLVKVNGHLVKVRIKAVQDKKCPKRGGPWGEVVALQPAMIGDGMMITAGTTAEGCLDDVQLVGLETWKQS